MPLVTGNEVARRRCQSADPVVRREHPDPAGDVGPGQGAGRVRTDAVAFDDVPAVAFQRDRIARETVDDQTADNRVAAADDETGRRQAVAIQLDERRRGLCRAVDDDRLVDEPQLGLQRNRRTPAPGMLNTIVSRSPLSALDSAIAFRSEPGPLSFVFVTAMLRLPAVTVVVSNTELLPGVGSKLLDVTPAPNVNVAPARVDTVAWSVSVSVDSSAGTAHVMC